uniref:CRAL-TRIO domain-containing protein n=1 Tax=Rhabditophanes sp. KR3021 TaxID=114890 RepID=A0AC35THF6_9BILA
MRSSQLTCGYFKVNSKKLSKKRGAVKEVYKNTKNPYDLSFDLAFFKNTLKQGTFLDDSGYKSAAMDKSISSPAGSSSRNRNVLLTSSYYGTGWLMAENLTPEDETNCLEWEAQMTVGGEKLKVNEVRDILHTNFAFISGAVTREGHPIMTFPDSKSQITFEQYHLLITYLIPLTKDCQKGFVLVIDRRNDKWSSLRILFSYIMNHFPEPISLICLLKPEGVFQRALEVGYRNFFDSTKYKVVICQSTTEMAEYLGADRLTVDVGGKVKYDHKNWIDDAMDIERMKSSASAIAESLNNFAKCLRETELPNDVETTERILNVQTNDRDAIKEDFRIAIRKGLSLLRHIRQAEEKPFADELSPTRYHNVTAVERMLIQLEETEISFDTFWEKHRLRLSNCLHLRIFEERFRKLQANFARNMIYLEEHREVGDCVERAVELAKEHDEYIKTAKEDVDLTEELRKEGDELISKHQDNELSGSLLPKCDELTRMSDALNSAFTRRTEVLKLSKTMHEQISEANIWCKNGVELLSNIPLEMTTTSASTAIKRMDEFLNNGARLQLEPFNAKQTINSLILLTTTDTSTLLAQVAERIDDLRRLGVAKRTSLLKFTTEREAKKPVQIVSPEKSTPPIPPKKQSLYSAISIEDESKSTTIEVSLIFYYL